MCSDGALQGWWREVEGTPPPPPLQFPVFWLPPCAWEGGLASARDTRPLQVLEANSPGILRLVTRHK